VKTSELKGAALDWAVAKCENIQWEQGDLDAGEYGPGFKPSTDWSVAGPIIEREEIALEPMADSEYGVGWLATRVEGPAICMEFGPTMLVAAMRCFVTSNLGDKVDVPKKLRGKSK
jgi:hypothetical protein